VTSHEWEMEVVDGGHLGAADCWRCKACGCAGGPVFRFAKDRPTRPPRPFIPGPALNLPEDCNEAKASIVAYVNERLDELEGLASKGLSPRYARKTRSVVKEVEGRPELAPALIEVVSLLYDVEAYHGRPTLAVVEDRLRTFGFPVSEES
jgi:hypothetical protein